MNLQATYNEFGSPVKFYRFQTKNAATTYDSRFGFLAGDYHEADHFPSLDYDKQQSIVKNHSNWSFAKASPFISTTSDLAWAISVAKKIRRNDPIFIAEISPGRAISGSIRYYHWFELVRELNAKIEHKAKNYHETVFLGQIPQEAITWYGTLEESERHNFEDEEEDDDSDSEQEQEIYEEDDEEDDDEINEEKGDGPLFYHCVHTLTKTSLVNLDLLSLMSQLKMESDDEQEGEEENEEGEEWYNQQVEADQLKMEKAWADEQESEEETEVTRIYDQMIADFIDDIGEQYFWEEDPKEKDFDVR